MSYITGDNICTLQSYSIQKSLPHEVLLSRSSSQCLTPDFMGILRTPSAIESPPERLRFPNHPSFFEHFDFGDEQIMKGLRLGYFKSVDPSEARVINPQQCEINSKGKRRRCDDERHPNGNLAYVKFRQESLGPNAALVVEKGDNVWSADVTAAFYSCLVAVASRWSWEQQPTTLSSAQSRGTSCSTCSWGIALEPRCV